MHRRIAVASLAMLAALLGCTRTVDHVTMDASRLVASPPSVRLACAYRLDDVVDARPAGDRAGGLGSHMFVFDDAPGVVRRELAATGMATGGDAGTPVQVRLLQLYLTQNTITKVPVVVLEVAPSGQAPFLVRAQKASMNWNGTQNEAYRAYADALSDATAQVALQLNARCAGASGG
jgi:hypothetical protein